MSWITEGTKTEPSKNMVLADTGTLAAGIITMTIIIDSHASTMVLFEQMDATGVTIINSQPLRMNGGATFILQIPLTVALNDRYRLRVNEMWFPSDIKASIIF